MDLTPYLPYLPILGVVVAAAGLAFNVRNARLQRKKADEERAKAAEVQPRKVFVGHGKSFESPNSRSVYVHNGSDYPIYNIRYQWVVDDEVPIRYAKSRQLEPGARVWSDVDNLAQERRILAAFDDHKGNRWRLDNAGSFKLQPKSMRSSMDYEDWKRS